MTQARAWQRPVYTYPPAYYQTTAYAHYYPYPQPAYYRGYYAPAPVVRAPKKQAPAIGVKTTPVNLSNKEDAQLSTIKPDSNIHEKKQAFIQKLLPYIERENARIQQRRGQAQQIIHRLETRDSISNKSRLWLKQLARQYRVKGDPVESHQARTDLLNKVDIIPPSLTLAQAATESAWGQSRFATQANNLFGIWTYDESKGLIPENRDENKKHLVRKFDDPGASVRYYMHTLNAHPAYQKLRDVRYQLRQKKKAPSGHQMATGLEKYSAKGERYIQLIRDLIRQNQWARLDAIHAPA